MSIVKQPVTETKVCFDPSALEEILQKIDNDPSVGPRNIAQIGFYSSLVETLTTKGEMMNVTVEREVEVPDEVGNKELNTVEVPADGGEKVWSAEDEADDNAE